LAGQDIACAVWLSISATVGNHKPPVQSWLGNQTVREKVPMYFLYGANDTKGSQFTNYLYNTVLKAKTDKRLPKLTGIKALEGTNLAGRDLLSTKSLKTDDLILSYLEKVMEEHGTNAWARRDVQKTIPVLVPLEQFLR
jgi:hypothetical protein